MKMEYFVRNAAILEFIMSVGTGPVKHTYNFLNFLSLFLFCFIQTFFQQLCSYDVFLMNKLNIAQET